MLSRSGLPAMSSTFVELVKDALLIYLGVGVVISAYSFIRIITNEDDREQILSKGCLIWFVIPITFTKVILTWPIYALDAIIMYRLRKVWMRVLERIEEDTDAEERNDTRKH